MKHQAIIDEVLQEARDISNPDWYHYSMFKQRLERRGIYSTEVLQQLSDALGL